MQENSTITLKLFWISFHLNTNVYTVNNTKYFYKTGTFNILHTNTA